MADTAKPRRIIDVSSPGESAPNASSRPIIVTHKPSVQDSVIGNPALAKENDAEKIPVARTESAEPSPKPLVPPQAQHAVTPSPLSTSANAPVQPSADSISSGHAKQLVDDRTYFMPVSQPPRRNSATWLLLAIAGTFVAAATAYIVLTM